MRTESERIRGGGFSAEAPFARAALATNLHAVEEDVREVVAPEHEEDDAVRSLPDGEGDEGHGDDVVAEHHEVVLVPRLHVAVRERRVEPHGELANREAKDPDIVVLPRRLPRSADADFANVGPPRLRAVHLPIHEAVLARGEPCVHRQLPRLVGELAQVARLLQLGRRAERRACARGAGSGRARKMG